MEEETPNPVVEKKSFRKKLIDADKAYIHVNKGIATIPEMSAHLSVTEKCIADYLNVRQIIDVKPSEETNFRTRLINSFVWKQIKKQFDIDEIETFQERYIQLMEQFKDDVEATEEKQILEMIKIELLIDRNHIERQQVHNHIKELQEMQKALFGAHNGDFEGMTKEERQEVESLEAHINTNKGAESAKTIELMKLLDKQAGINRDLKGTRDQRIDKIEKGTTTFTDLVKAFVVKDTQERESKMHQLLQQASQKEFKKLSQPISFADETKDSPFLSAESLEIRESV